jgi:hypothetical protein
MPLLRATLRALIATSAFRPSMGIILIPCGKHASFFATVRTEYIFNIEAFSI